MPIREKVVGRSGSRRRSTVVAKKLRPAARTGRPAPVVVTLKSDAEAIKPSTGGSGYAKALRFLSTLSDFERLRIVRYNSDNFNLDRMRSLLKKIGNPHDQFRSVHIAGTKGKGSTCAMVAAMLQSNGYKVGLYTSPHLVDVRERIVIDGEMIPQASFARLVRLMESSIAAGKPTLTSFDVLTAIAFKYFADHKVDIAVIETGLG